MRTWASRFFQSGICLSVALSAGWAQADLQTTSLKVRLSSELFALNAGKPITVDPALKRTLSTRKVLVVGGFINETKPDIIKQNGYLADTMAALKGQLGAAVVKRINPNSLFGVDQNAELLAQTWRAEYRSGGGRPLVILAHSKGAAEALISVLRYPDLIESGIIDRLIFVQGAFYGSPIADYASPALGWVVPVRWSGLESMKRSVQSRLMNSEVVAFRRKQSAHTQKMLSSRTYFVASAQDPSKMYWQLKPAGYLMHKKLGANDGVLLTADEKVPGIGTFLGTLQADHMDLVGAQYSSATSIAYKKAFARALFAEVYSGR